ncbi:hypothetical protein PLANTIT3_50179 [Plantibacter sp. T3]|nr:hypothetical protein PLANTIT3_50179 [Plantibacter sp. T3]
MSLLLEWSFLAATLPLEIPLEFLLDEASRLDGRERAVTGARDQHDSSAAARCWCPCSTTHVPR